jgi:hypothetical protein
VPFRSVKQRAFLYAKHPQIAKKWEAEYGGKVVPRRGSYGKACPRCKYQQKGRQ